jgi:hypothetical protein
MLGVCTLDVTFKYFKDHVYAINILRIINPPWPLVHKRTISTERSLLVGEINANFAERECRVVSATDSHGR